jgi:predicted kinase
LLLWIINRNNEKLEVLVLIGIPGSGKSTWAKDFVSNNSDWIRVNRDDFRDMLKTSQTCENKIEDMITGLVNDVISSSLSRKLNVIVDNTNLKVKYINSIIDTFKYSASINYRVFDISKDKAIERIITEIKKVGKLVINKMYKDYKILLDSFDFQPVSKISHRPNILPDFESKLKDVVIFDIDGTLALMEIEDHLIG